MIELADGFEKQHEVDHISIYHMTHLGAASNSVTFQLSDLPKQSTGPADKCRGMKPSFIVCLLLQQYNSSIWWARQGGTVSFSATDQETQTLHYLDLGGEYYLCCLPTTTEDYIFIRAIESFSRITGRTNFCLLTFFYTTNLSPVRTGLGLWKLKSIWDC